jgi:hypothetical protein
LRVAQPEVPRHHPCPPMATVNHGIPRRAKCFMGPNPSAGRGGLREG